MILHQFGKIAPFDVDFTVVGFVLVSAGFFSSAECFPDIPPFETYTKETKVGKLWRSFLQNQVTAAATSRDLRSFLPKTVQLANHGQQCNVTHRKPGRDLPGSNPLVSYFFTLIILYREAITKNAPYAWGNFRACAITRFQKPQQLSWAGRGRGWRARRSTRAQWARDHDPISAASAVHVANCG